jgi:hypothetical protein
MTPPVPVAEVEPDVTPEAVVVFGPRVQPVLANLCAECHAKPDHPGTFKLACGTTPQADQATTRHNLRVAAAHLKKDDPAASPLLVKALATHGGMKQPAFVNRQAAPFRVLEAWAHLAVGTPAAPPPPMVPPMPPPAVAPMVPPAPVGSVGTPVLPPVEAEPKPVLPPTEPVSKPVLPPVEAPPVAPAHAPAPKPAPPPIPPAADVEPLPAAPLPMIPAPPPIPRAAFGQDAKPLTPAAPNPEGTGPAVDEFDPAVFNRAVQAKRPAPMK